MSCGLYVSDEEPRIGVDGIRRVKKLAAGRWQFAWRLRNLTAEPIKLFSVRVPHGKFKGEERRFNPAIEIGGEKSGVFETRVICDEPAASVVENAFLILLTEWRQERWRVFVRLSVAINQKGEPGPTVELVTTQRVGFSAMS